MTGQETRDEWASEVDPLAERIKPALAGYNLTRDQVSVIQREAAAFALFWMRENGYRKHPEPEWEYGVWNGLGHFRYFAPTLAAARQAIEEERRGFVTNPKRVIKRRTKREAGPWLPIEEDDRG